MTKKDNTREKLLDSMRKTKSASTDVQTGNPPVTGSAPKKKAASKSRSRARPQSPKNKKTAASPAVRVADLYQSGGRVWPD